MMYVRSWCRYTIIRNKAPANMQQYLICELESVSGLVLFVQREGRKYQLQIILYGTVISTVVKALKTNIAVKATSSI